MAESATSFLPVASLVSWYSSNALSDANSARSGIEFSSYWSPDNGDIIFPMQSSSKTVHCIASDSSFSITSLSLMLLWLASLTSSQEPSCISKPSKSSSAALPSSHRLVTEPLSRMLFFPTADNGGGDPSSAARAVQAMAESATSFLPVASLVSWYSSNALSDANSARSGIEFSSYWSPDNGDIIFPMQSSSKTVHCIASDSSFSITSLSLMLLWLASLTSSQGPSCITKPSKSSSAALPSSHRLVAELLSRMLFFPTADNGGGDPSSAARAVQAMVESATLFLFVS